MRTTRKLLVGLMTAALLGTAYAETGKPGCEGMGPFGQEGTQGRSGMRFDPAQRAERHLGQLKGELKLTPQQEPLWQAFAEKVQSQAGKGFQAMRERQADTQLSAPERMTQMETRMSERLTAMKDVHESFDRLYAVLTPEQKTVADRHMSQMGHREARRGGHGPRGRERDAAT